MSFFSNVTDRFLGNTTTESALPTLLDMLLAASKMQDLLKGQPLRTSIHVAIMAAAVARQMDLPERDLQSLLQAALVYDLGLARMAPEVFSAISPQMNEKQIFLTHSLSNFRIMTGELMTAEMPTQESQSSSEPPVENSLPLASLPLPELKQIDPDVEAALDVLTPLMTPLNGKDLFTKPLNKSSSEIVSEEPIAAIFEQARPVEGTPPKKATLPKILSQHPLALSDFLHSLGLSLEVRSIVEAHHELCDGTGYPFGLTRHQIPLGSRILCLVDTVSALMLENKQVANLSDMVQLLDNFLQKHSVAKFDPDVAVAFREIMESYPDILKLARSRDLESMCRNLLSEREIPLTGGETLVVAEAFADLVDNMVPLYRASHSRKVAHLSLKTAQAIGISKAQCGELVLAALLHDIGMIAVPLGILVKHGSLTESEWQIIKDHPHWTLEILRHIPQFKNVVLWASEHHERLNGKGYPTARRGTEISIGGRIIALADVFDALISLRPYRSHVFEPKDALPIIIQGRYTQFDTNLAAKFRTIIQESGLEDDINSGPPVLSLA